MKRDLRRLAAFKAREARRLYDAAADHLAAYEEMIAEAGRLVDEAHDLLDGIKPLPSPETPGPATTVH